MSSRIYLDNCATTEVRSEVIAVMQKHISGKWGNPSSIHSAGKEARAAIDKARGQIAALIGAKPSEILFTSGGTFANNAAILGRASFVEETNKGRHLITSAIEHSSSLSPARHLKSRGWDVTILGVDHQGFINLEELQNSIRSETSIISIMLANNEIGTIQPIEKIARIANSRGIFFHSDAVQGAGRIDINVSNCKVDTMSLSGHKFYGPKGIGVLYVREGVELRPLFFGGGQEKGLFPGTEGLANIVGIGEAARLIKSELSNNILHLRELQKALLGRLRRNADVRITGPQDISKRLPGHVSVLVPEAVGSELVTEASRQGVFLSSVSACSSGEGAPSHVLKSIGISDSDAIGALRISAGRFNTVKECEQAADVIERIISPQGVGVPAFFHPPVPHGIFAF